MAENTTDLFHPVFVKFKARQLDAAYARALAICDDDEPRDGAISPPASSCVAVTGAWARQAAASLEQRCASRRLTDVDQRRLRRYDFFADQ